MSNLIDEKGVSHLLIDSFLKAVRDNTIGNPGGNPDQVVSVGFSNVSKMISAAIGESIIKHFYLAHDDVTLVKNLTNQHFRAVEAVVEKQRLLDGLKVLNEHPAATSLQLQQAYQHIHDDLSRQLRTVEQDLDRMLKGLHINDIDIKTATAEDILDKIVDEKYGKYLLENLGRLFNYGNFVKAALMEVDSSDPASMLDYATTWTGILTIPMQSWVVEAGQSLGWLEKIPAMNAKTLVGLAARGIVVGVLTDLAFKAGYTLGEWIFTTGFKELFGEQLYEMQWFIKYSDLVLPALLTELSGDELQNAIAVNMLINRTFQHENKLLYMEDMGFMLGNNEYKKMDHAKVLKVYQGLYQLLSGNDEALAVTTALDLAQHLQRSETITLFKQYEGEKITILNDDPVLILRNAQQDDTQGLAYRYALKNLNSWGCPR